MTLQFWQSLWKVSLLGALVLCNAFISTFNRRADAQIVPDNTLGNESSVVNPNTNVRGLPATLIEGGATRGINLFQSFSQFNVGDGERVYFANPTGIENILTRVTGNNLSNILGTLGVDGNANLFLLNPNGIIFGENASLDVGGSFLGTTANGIKFGEQGFFNATNPEAPPLLTVNPSALFFNQINPTAEIKNSSTAPAGTNPAGFNVFGLRVPDGKSLLLVGGDVKIDGGGLNAYGGRVEIGGLAEPRNVNLTVDGDNLNLGFPENVTRASVSFTNQARVHVEAAGGGDIAVNARNIDILEESTLSAGIGQGLGTPETVAGDITLNANDAVTLESGDIFNTVEAGATGNGGDINIQAGSLTLTDSAQLLTVIRPAENDLPAGRGNGGDVNINVRGAVTFANPQPGILNGISSLVDTGAVGDTGNVMINAGSLEIKDDSKIQAGTRGKGNAGDITLNANDAVTLESGDIFNTVEAGATGNGGDINIQADSLTLTDSAQLLTDIRAANNDLPGGRGNGGDININVRGAVTFANLQPGILNGISSSVDTGAVGDAGNVMINAGSLEIKDGSEIQASTFGKGNAGDITINARDSVMLDGRDEGGVFSRIINAVQPDAQGNAGNINITANALKLTNGAFFSSSILGQGDGGNINITANALKLTNGAFFSSSTFGQGNGGNINIDVRDATTLENQASIGSNVFETGVGKGGDIRLNTGTLNMTGGSSLSTNVLGEGNAGNIIVNARDTIELDDITGDNLTGIQSSLLTNGVGKGGNIEIATGSLFVRNGALLQAFSDGQGDAGNITVDVRDIAFFDTSEGNRFSSRITNSLGSNGVGNAGNIRITAREISFKNGSRVNAASFGQGDAGNITIDARDKVSFDGVGGRFDIESGASTFASEQGRGGEISVQTGTLSLTNGGNLSSFAPTNAGNITINASDTVIIDGVGSNNRSSWINSILLPGGTTAGKGGDIQINTGSLSVTNGAQISASTGGNGNAGDITINASNITASGVAGDGSLSGVFSTVEETGVGRGGNIRVDSDFLSISDRAIFNTSTFGQGDAGQIFLNITDSLNLNEGYILTSVGPGGVGTAGDIDIRARSLLLSNGSEINSALLRSLQGKPAARGRSGNIRIDAIDSVTISGVNDRGLSSGLFTATDQGTSGEAGDIDINTGTFTVSDGGIVSATTSNSDNGGNITINANDFNAIDGGQLTTNTRDRGNAGSIKLNVTKEINIAGSDPNFSDRVTRVNQRLQQPGETDQLNDVIFNQGAASGLFANTEVGSTGQGGNIFIDPPQIIIRDGAKVSVNSNGTGDAGNIFILGDSLILDNGATISAQTNSSQGGNIDFQITDYLLLRRNSNISTTAGIQQAGGDGGNITINADAIVAILNENSDITANAFTGMGGGVNINTQGVFGMETQEVASDTTNDITASSQLGVQGEVNVNQPDVDPTQEIIELPEGIGDRSDRIGQVCPRNTAENDVMGEFFITGRGGLPPSPDQPLSIDVVWEDTRSTATTRKKTPKTTAKTPEPKANKITPATGWVFNEKGEVTLISSTSKPTVEKLGSASSCPM